jgi:hypothetical protein
MVESRNNVTEMAMRLHAQYRWCITGTPIQRRLDDLFGLLRFLRTIPFDTYRWWVDIIRDPYEVCFLPPLTVCDYYMLEIIMLYIVYKLLITRLD